MLSATVRKFRIVSKEDNRMITRNMDNSITLMGTSPRGNPLKSRIKIIFLIRVTTSAERYCNGEQK